MKLIDLVRKLLVEMEYAGDTRRLYVRWIVRYIHFHKMQHPAGLGTAEIEAFKTYLVIKQHLSANTCNQALDALKFLYERVLDRPELACQITKMRSRQRKTLPTTASPAEIESVITDLQAKYRLMAYLCYGSGLSIGECVRLRLSNLDIEHREITVRGRQTVLPERILPLIQSQAELAAVWPGNVERYLFPSSRQHNGRCWFVSESSLQKEMKKSTAGLSKRLTPKVLRYSFVRHLLKSGYDVRTVQDVAGYAHVKSVLVYQRMNNIENVVSPLDNIGKK